MTLPNTFKAPLLPLACPTLPGCSNNPPGVRVEQLLKTDKTWDGATYAPYPAGQPELTVLKITIPAKTALNWHSHPMPNIVYVVSGELRIETRDGKHTTTVQAGQVLPEVINTVHRGVSTDKPVELIVFYAGSPGMPLSQ